MTVTCQKESLNEHTIVNRLIPDGIRFALALRR
jgi:hypothetical protein